MFTRKSKLKLLTLSVCLAAGSGSVYGASVAELEERLKTQERNIEILKRKVKGTRGAVKQNRNRINEVSDRFSVNGFVSVGMSVNDGDALELTQYDISDDYSFSSIAKMGLQFTFKLGEDLDLTTQLVSRGTSDYKIEAEWAYLNWRATEKLTVKLGRQRIPYYYLSEYLDVAYAYPWVRPPIEHYNIPMTAVDGLSADYTMSLGDFSFVTSAYVAAGAGYSETLEGGFTLNQSFGFSELIRWKEFEMRLAYSRSHPKVGQFLRGGKGGSLVEGLDAIVTLSENPAFPVVAGALGLGPAPEFSPFAFDGLSTEYASMSLSYDDGKLLMISELSRLRIDNSPQTGGDAAYIMAGYRMGKWMPHFTMAKMYTNSNTDRHITERLEQIDYALKVAQGIYASASANPAQALVAFQMEQLTNALPGMYNAMGALMFKQNSYTLGLTYDFNPRVKIKAEATLYNNFGKSPQLVKDGSGNYVKTMVDNDGVFESERIGQLGNGRTAVYSFSVDAVF